MTNNTLNDSGTITPSKFCPKCKTTLSITFFHKDKNNPDGLNKWCIECKQESHQRIRAIPEFYLKQRFNNMKKGRRRERLITYEELMECWNDFCEDNIKHDLHPYACAYTQIPMTFTQGQGHISTNLSVDRIDNSKPYTKDNITFCTFKFNGQKGEMDMNILRKILKFFKRKGIKYEIE